MLVLAEKENAFVKSDENEGRSSVFCVENSKRLKIAFLGRGCKCGGLLRLSMKEGFLIHLVFGETAWELEEADSLERARKGRCLVKLTEKRKAWSFSCWQTKSLS